MSEATAPPEVPPDYYKRMSEVDRTHWWHRGMRSISASLLGERLERRGQHLLDAGCGTGGFLLWARELGSFERLCGVDLSPTAIEFAGKVVPDADLRQAAIRKMPFEADSFHIVVCNDVIQHLGESELQPSLAELRRVLRPDGALLVRTNGARRAWREGPEWRAFDPPTLTAALEGAGFQCERLTYVNVVGSLWSSVRGRSPHSPSETRHGLPSLHTSPTAGLSSRLLRAEARYLTKPSRRLPYGHTMLALASPKGGERS